MLKMTVGQVKRTAARRERVREALQEVDADLMIQVGKLISEREEGMRETARKLGVSVGYVSDICHRRRKISNHFLELLLTKGS